MNLTNKQIEFLLKKYCNRDYWKTVIGLSDEDDWKLQLDMSKLDSTRRFSFSEYICEYDEKVLLSQKVLNIKYRTGLDVCLLTSLFNAYPKLFYNDPNNIRKYRYHKLGDKYGTLKEVTNFFNSKFHKDVLYESEFTMKDTFDDINNNYPVILCRNNLHQDKVGHAVSIYGIDNDGIYYFENGKDTLVNSICIELAQRLFNYCFNPRINKTTVENLLEKLKLLTVYEFIQDNYLYFFTDNFEYSIKVYDLLKRIFMFKKKALLSYLNVNYLLIFSNLKCIRLNRNTTFSEIDKPKFGIQTEKYYTQSFIDLSNRLNKLMNQ